MDLKNFDKQIKSTLENLEPPYESASWFALEKRMNTAFSEEQPASVEPVDLVVKRSLERLEVPFQAADWNLLNTRLNQDLLVRRIRLSKLSEAAIFLLLLVNIEGFLGGFREVLKPAVPVAPKSNVPMADKQRHKVIKHKLAPKTTTEEAATPGLAEKMIALLSAPFISGNSSPETPVETAPVAANVPVAENASLLDAGNFYKTSGIVRFNKMAQLPQSKTPDFAWKNFFEVIPGVITPTPHKSNGLYAVSFASTDQNHIKSSDLDVHEKGFGGGIAVGYRKGKWGVETGISYAHKNYTPKKDIDIYAGNPVDGFLGAYVRDVDADVFSVPVKVTRRLAKVGKTSAHAVAGITANVATEKRFGYKVIKYPPLSPSPSPGVDVNQNPIPVKNNQGVFEGGALNTNAYASIDLGIRVEQPLGKHYIAFVEPSYRHALGGGFGPKRERINTFSWQAGIMASL